MIFEDDREQDYSDKISAYVMDKSGKEWNGSIIQKGKRNMATMICQKKTHYVLFSCNQWKEYSSMRFLGATDDPETLYVMIGSCIRANDMLYGYDNSKESWKCFQEDYHHGEINLGMLQYGYVEIYEESSILSRKFAEEFPKAVSTWRALGGKSGE